MPERFLELNPEEQAILCKRRFHDLVHGGPLAVKELADKLGWAPYNLYRYCDADLLTHHAPHQGIVKVSLLQANFAYLDFLDSLAGRAAFAIPKPSEHHTDINKATTKALKSFSGYMEEVSDLMERLDDGENMFDQDWDRELRDIEIACRAHQAKVESLLHTVRMARGVVKIVKLGTDRDGFQIAKAARPPGK